jgi:crossover junction endodeoxyribonuclease RusA
MSDSISFFVAGEPQPKGSTRTWMVAGKPITTSSNRNLKQWELRIAHEAQAKAAEVGWTFNPHEAYLVSGEFYFARPKSYPKGFAYEHTVRPDLDKCARALLDGITNVLIHDDAQVVEIQVFKEYADEHVPGSPGIKVEIQKAPGRAPR